MHGCSGQLVITIFFFCSLWQCVFKLYFCDFFAFVRFFCHVLFIILNESHTVLIFIFLLFSNKCDSPPCSLLHRWRHSSESIITSCSMHNHDEEKRREQNLFVHSGKSEAELALHVLYYLSYWQTWSITRPLCNSWATCFRDKLDILLRLLLVWMSWTITGQPQNSVFICRV